MKLRVFTFNKSANSLYMIYNYSQTLIDMHNIDI